MPKKLTVTAILLAVAFLALLGFNHLPKTRVRAQLNLGQKYLEEMQYEDALLAFQSAVDIDERNVQAYLGVVDVYLGMAEKMSADENVSKEEQTRKIKEYLDEAEKAVAQAEAIVAEDYPDAGDVLEEVTKRKEETKKKKEENTAKEAPSQAETDETEEAAEEAQEEAKTVTRTYEEVYEDSLADAIEKNKDFDPEWVSINDEFPNGMTYALYDVTGDGIKELLVQTVGSMPSWHLLIYSYEEGTTRQIGDIPDGRCEVAGFGNGILLIESAGTGGGFYLTEEKWNGSAFEEEEIYAFPYDESGGNHEEADVLLQKALRELDAEAQYHELVFSDITDKAALKATFKEDAIDSKGTDSAQKSEQQEAEPVFQLGEVNQPIRSTLRETWTDGSTYEKKEAYDYNYTFDSASRTLHYSLVRTLEANSRDDFESLLCINADNGLYDLITPLRSIEQKNYSQTEGTFTYGIRPEHFAESPLVNAGDIKKIIYEDEFSIFEYSFQVARQRVEEVSVRRLGKEYTTFIYSYSATNDLEKVEWTIRDDGESRHKIEYQKGHIIKSVSESSETGEWQTIYEYNNQGQLSMKRWFDQNTAFRGKEFVTEHYSYDSEGRLSERQYKDNNFDISYNEKYEYDNIGRLIKMTRQYSDGTQKEEKTFEWTD